MAESVTDANRILYNDDCLNVLSDELALPTGGVDLIYLDPPFNSNSHYNLPFKGKDKDARPVEAFKDTWSWGSKEDDLMRELSPGPRTRQLADIVKLAQAIDPGGQAQQSSLAAYLLNMAVRLLPMRRVLSGTGSIYLHCDPTASHYLKVVMDIIFGRQSFRNEVIWSYRTGGVSKHWFAKKHDVLLFYTRSAGKNKSNSRVYTFNQGKERSYSTNSPPGFKEIETYQDEYGRWYTMASLRDVWDINAVGRTSGERLGYPTQKPLALLERVIGASSNPGDLVLDPFCGCGTAVHAAEKLGRRWLGVDVSAFSVGLVRERMLRNFEQLTTDDVLVRGVPVSVADAEDLAKRDKFEFEKWVCGAIGAEGMFHAPGSRGADGGVDGVVKFYPFRLGQEPKPEYAIVQVKGGGVTPDAVKALKATVERFEATAGVMVCFSRYMGTVENQRSRDTFSDDSNVYPVIQGYSVEDLLAGKPLDLPLYGYRRRGGRISAQSELLGIRPDERADSAGRWVKPP